MFHRQSRARQQAVCGSLRYSLFVHTLLIVSKMLYMVVEHFKNQDAVAVYRRFRDSGRMAPAGLVYVSSWVDDKLERCYQLMETHDRTLLDKWMGNWSDLIDFEVHPVTTRTAVNARPARMLFDISGSPI